MIYSFHHFYYWLRGGVESGMAYCAKIFRRLGLDAKFVFATTFPNDNIQHEMERLGFMDFIPKKARRKHSLITAGRLAKDKRTDWVVMAAVEAKKNVPDLSLDIYGEGSGKAQIRELIDTLGCSDYVHLCGFQKLDESYQNYEAYVSASCGETFGVTLLEAIGSGLAVIGFDLPYGIQVFVDEGENGYKIKQETVQELAKGIVRLFSEADLETFQQKSYEKAKSYLTGEVEKRWKSTLDQAK